MPGADILSSYPYVIVRIGCRRCTRKGAYRLARLAAKYGAEIPMLELLAHLAGDCAIWDARHPGAPRCGAYFVDLEFPAPAPRQAHRRHAAPPPRQRRQAPNGAAASEEDRSAPEPLPERFERTYCYGPPESPRLLKGSADFFVQ